MVLAQTTRFTLDTGHIATTQAPPLKVFFAFCQHHHPTAILICALCAAICSASDPCPAGGWLRLPRRRDLEPGRSHNQSAPTQCTSICFVGTVQSAAVSSRASNEGLGRPLYWAFSWLKALSHLIHYQDTMLNKPSIPYDLCVSIPISHLVTACLA